MSTGARIDGSLGFVFPIALLPPSEEPPPQFSTEEKESLSKAIFFFLSTAAKGTNSESSRYLGVLIKTTEKLNRRALRDEEIDAATIARATAEAAVAAGIQMAIGTAYPPARGIFIASNFAEILRPGIQSALESKIESERSSMRPIYSRNGLANNVNHAGRILQYGAAWLAADIPTWPSRITSGAAGPIVDSGEWMGEQFEAGRAPSTRFPISHMMSPIGGVVPVYSKPQQSTIPEQPELATQPEPNRQDAVPPLDLTSPLTAELAGRVTPLQQPFDPYSLSPGMEPPRDFGTLQDVPSGIRFQHEPHPITQVIGGEFYISGGSSTPVQYGGQINFTFAGPKDLPNPYNLGPPGRVGASSGGEGAVHRAPPDLFPYRAEEYNDLSQAMMGFQRQEYAWNHLVIHPDLDSDTSTVNPDYHIDRLTSAIKQVQDIQTTINRAMQLAWTVHDQNRISNRRGKSNKAQRAMFNHDAKSILWNTFKVPRNDKLREGDLKQSGTLKTYKDLQTAYEKKLAVARQDKDIATSRTEFDAAKSSLQGKEYSDAPVDLQQYQADLATVGQLGGQLAAKIRVRYADAPQEAANKVQKVDDDIALLRNREFRVAKISSNYTKICSREKGLLGAIAIKGKEAEVAAGMQELENETALLGTQIDEMVAQDPTNTERNAKLTAAKNDAASRCSNLSVAKHDSDKRKCYQQYCETEASIVTMEESDAPVDPKKLSEALLKIKTLHEQYLAKIRTGTAALPESNLRNIETSISERTDALLRLDLRLAKITSGYIEFCSLGESLPSKFGQPHIQQEAGEELTKALQLNEALTRQINEFLEQDPLNAQRNAHVLLILEDITVKSEFLSFCPKSLEEKSSELKTLRDLSKDIDASPDEREKAATAYRQRLVFLAPQSVTIEMQCLSDNPALDELRLIIGNQMCTAQRKDARALQWYRRCKTIEPDNSLWPRALAIGYLDTLSYTDAERSILEALAIDGTDEAVRKTANHIVMDKYQTFSLLLEFIPPVVDLFDTEDQQVIAEQKTTHSFVLKVVRGAGSILDHPSVLKKWLPYVLSLDPDLKARLIDRLSENKSTDFGLFDVTSLAGRVIPLVNETVSYYFSAKQYPKLTAWSKTIAGVAGRVQQVVLNPYLSMSSCWRDYGEYTVGKISGEEFGFNTTLTSFNLASSLLSLTRSDQNAEERAARLRTLQPHSYLYAALETVASTDFSCVLRNFNLAWRSQDVVARIVNCWSPENWKAEDTKDLIKIAALGYVVYSVYQICVRKEKEISKA